MQVLDGEGVREYSHLQSDDDNMTQMFINKKLTGFRLLGFTSHYKLLVQSAFDSLLFMKK